MRRWETAPVATGRFDGVETVGSAAEAEEGDESRRGEKATTSDVVCVLGGVSAPTCACACACARVVEGGGVMGGGTSSDALS